MILDCSNNSVLDYSIEEEITIRSARYTNKNRENPYLRKQEEIILLLFCSIDQLLNSYNNIFYRFVEYNDVTILYEDGTLILRCIIIKVVSKMLYQTEKENWETEREIMEKLESIFHVDKTLQFERWTESYYLTIFNEEMYEVLKLQIFILNLVIGNEGIPSPDLGQYIKMCIKISLKSRMLELLIPMYEILKRIGRPDILLTKYYYNSTTISSRSTTTLPRSESITTDNLTIPSSWYKRLYNWIINTVQQIRSFFIKH